MPVIGGSITLKTTTPNFDRDRVKLISDLANSRNTTQYDVGHLVYCQEDGNHYKFWGKLDEITNKFGVDFDSTTGYFRLFTTSSDEDDSVESEAFQELSEKVENNSSMIRNNTSMIQDLYDKVYPITTSFTVKTGASNVSSVNLKGSTVSSVKLNFGLDQNGVKVTPKSIALYINNVKTDLDPSDSSYTLGDVTEDTTLKVTFTLESGITKSTSTISIKFYPYSYFGVIDDEVEDITSLTPVLLGSRAYSTTVTQNNQKNCFAYPSSFGSLISIKDDKNYELIKSYVKTTTTVNGVQYYVYTLQYASTVDNYKLIFS